MWDFRQRYRYVPYHLATLAEVVVHLRLPAQVIIGSPDLKANHNIKQVVEMVEGFAKYPRLRKLLDSEMDGRRILVFLETKRGCDEVRVAGGGGDSAARARLLHELVGRETTRPPGIVPPASVHLCIYYAVLSGS